MSLIIFERVDFVLKKILFKGVGTAIATPFNSDGVNIPAFEKLLSFQLLNSVDSLISIITTTTNNNRNFSINKINSTFYNRRLFII